MAELTRETGPWFQTYTGRKVNPMTLVSGDVILEDVAHALALTCRFGGHCKEFYSVAQHSILGTHLLLSGKVADIPCLEKIKDRGTIAKWFMIHDAAEAYLLDMPRPVKYADLVNEFDKSADWAYDFRKLEDKVQEACNQAFMGRQPTEQEEAAVKDIDNVMLATERDQLVNHLGEAWALPLPPAPEQIFPWCPTDAETTFLKSFAVLFDEAPVPTPAP